MRRPLTALLVLALAACATPAAPPSAVPSTSAAPTAAPSPLPDFGFPDLPLVAGTSDGEIRPITSTGLGLPLATPCPGRRVADLAPSPDGRHLLIVCGAPPFTLFVWDRTTAAPVGVGLGVLEAYGAAWADDRSIALIALGDCPMPAPVCRSRVVLVDWRGGAQREILPSDYLLEARLEHTALGLSLYRPRFANAGVTPDERSGTFLWNGAAWTRYSSAELVDADAAGRALLQAEVELPAFGRGVAVVERSGTTERRLTPADVTDERAIGLGDGGRVVASRAQATADRSLVVYADGREERVVGAIAGQACAGVVRGWVVCRTSRGIFAYSLAKGVSGRWPGSMELASAVAPLPVLAPSAPLTLTPEQAAAKVRETVVDFRPILLPAWLPNGTSAELVVSDGGYTITYRVGNAKILYAPGLVMGSNMPGDHAVQRELTFRGDTHAFSQIDDDRLPLGRRFLIWSEAGYAAGGPPGRASFFLSSDGIDETTFWKVANSIR